MVNISLTELAAKKVEEFKSKEPKPAYGLRIWLASGGCSGLQYGMAFDDKKEDDNVVQSNGVNILVDPMSARNLEGTQIDYVESLEGAGFKITNPNVRSSCACGQSVEV